MPEETAGAPQADANHMQSYGNLERKPRLPPTQAQNVALRKARDTKGACTPHPGYLYVFLTVWPGGGLCQFLSFPSKTAHVHVSIRLDEGTSSLTRI